MHDAIGVSSSTSKTTQVLSFSRSSSSLSFFSSFNEKRRYASSRCALFKVYPTSSPPLLSRSTPPMRARYLSSGKLSPLCLSETREKTRDTGLLSLPAFTDKRNHLFIVVVVIVVVVVVVVAPAIHATAHSTYAT